MTPTSTGVSATPTSHEIVLDVDARVLSREPQPEPTFGANTRRDNNSPIRAGNRLPCELAFREIVEHGRGLRSVKVPLQKLRVAGNRLIGDDGEYLLGTEGMTKLAAHFRAPADYLDRLAPRIRDELLNYHLHSSTTHAGNRVYHRDGVFVDLGRSDLYTLESAQVLDAVRDGFGTDAFSFEAEEPEIANEAFGLNLISPRIAIEVRAGDELQAGIRIEHSYTGDRATSISGFITRILCTNGLITREGTGIQRRTRRLNADREDAGSLQIDQIRRLAAEVRKEIEPKLEAIRNLANERADEAELRQFLAQARMNSRAMMQQVRDAWETEENERTAFGLFNALTRLATHSVTLSARQRGTLSRLAGIYANRSRHLCPHCFSVLNTAH